MSRDLPATSPTFTLPLLSKATIALLAHARPGGAGWRGEGEAGGHGDAARAARAAPSYQAGPRPRRVRCRHVTLPPGGLPTSDFRCERAAAPQFASSGESAYYPTGTHLASSASAKTPAASGAAADVPEWVVVHLPYRSVVACNESNAPHLGIRTLHGESTVLAASSPGRCASSLEAGRLGVRCQAGLARRTLISICERCERCPEAVAELRHPALLLHGAI